MRFILSYILTITFIFLAFASLFYIMSIVHDYSFKEYFNFFIEIYLPFIVFFGTFGIVGGELMIRMPFINTDIRRLLTLLILGVLYGACVAWLLYALMGELTIDELSTFIGYIVISVVGAFLFFVSRVIVYSLFRKKQSDPMQGDRGF